MKIIFDRSAFHGERFELLKGSRLPVLVGAGKILVYHTTNFLDETFRMANSKKQSVKDALRRQWPFLKLICNGGWFRPLLVGQPPKLQSVCDDELEGGEKDSSWPLVAADQRRIGEAILTKRLEESGPFPELENVRPIYDQNAQLKKENMELRTQLRSERTLGKDETFLEYYRSLVDEAAWLLIHRPSELPIQLAALNQPQVKLEAWKHGPEKFPHFTAFLECFIYSLYDAERNQNSKLDPNWLPDAEQLCFLVDVDAVVSSDRGFMKGAVETLWRPRQKSIFTPEEFVVHISQLH